MSAKPAPTCVLPPASASYIVWLDSRPTARYAESERRGPVNRVRSVVADGPQNLGVITELARHGQAGGLMMEPHPGVFVSTVRTGEWEPDPEVPGSEMHELVHADGVWAGLTRFTSAGGPRPVDAVPARDDPRAPGRGGHRDRRRPDADAQAGRPGLPCRRALRRSGT